MPKDLAHTNGSCPDQVDDYELPNLDQLLGPVLGPVIAAAVDVLSEDLPAAGPAYHYFEELGRSFYSELLTSGIALHRPSRRRRRRPHLHPHQKRRRSGPNH